MMKMKKSFFLFLAVFMIFIPSILYAHGNTEVHPYIAVEALFIWPKDVNTNPSAYQEIHQYLGMAYDTTVGDCESAKTVNGGGIREGDREEDDYDPMAEICNTSALGYGFYHHFYQCDWSEPYNGLNTYVTGYSNYGSLSQAKYYWNEIKKYYPNNKPLAYWFLGRTAHLLQDISVPAHVHNDSHIPPDGDSYENYMKTDPYYKQWNAYDAMQLESLPSNWALNELFYNLAQRAQYFPSDDFNGNTKDVNGNELNPSWFNGWPSNPSDMRVKLLGLPCFSEGEGSGCFIEDSDLFRIGDKLMPLAIQYTAALYKLFWNETHGTLSGTVKDQNTNTAISDATVQLYGPNSSVLKDTKTTDSSGNFSFSDLEQGDYYLKITKSGYDLKFTDFYTVSAGAPNYTGTIYLIPSVGLPPAPTLVFPGLSSEPGEEINTTTPTFQWNSVTGADGYGLYISKYPYGESNIVYQNEAISGSVTLFNLQSGYLFNGEKYRWNMRAHTSAGWSNYSDRVYFKVNTSTHAITIPSGPSGSPNPVIPGGTANLSVSAVDSLGHNLSYAWTASCPTLSSNGTLIGTATQTPQWIAPVNNTGSQQDCTMEVVVSDGQGLSQQATYIQGVSPGGAISLSISDGIRLLEPPPYLLNGNATVDAVIKNISGTVLVIDRFQAIGQFREKDGSLYERFWPAVEFSPPLSLNPGDTYHYTKLLTDGFPALPTTATVMIYVKFNNIPGQEPITNFESGATAQLVFEVGHTITLSNGPGGSPNPVSSGGTVNLSVNAADSYGHGLNYSWTASCPGLSSNGTFSSSTAQNPTWLAPTNNTGSQQSCTIQVAVNDGTGGLTQTGMYAQNVSPSSITPTILASGLNNPYGITVDSSSVYWTETDGTYPCYTAKVKKVPVDGGTETTISSSPACSGGGGGIKVDDTSIYWAVSPGGGSGHIYKIPIIGGTIATLATANQPDDIAVDSSYVYWAENNGGSYGSNDVRKVPVNGGTVTALTGTGTGHASLAIDETYAYFNYMLNDITRIGKVIKNGGSIIDLASNIAWVSGISVDSNYVYWAEPSSGTIKKVSINGGAITTLASGLYDPRRIVIDDGNVYFAEFANKVAGAGAIKSVPKTGGAIVILANGLSGPYGIAIDNNYVYWTEYNSSGTVKKILKGADTVPPAGSLSINNGNAYANSISVTLTISATDPSWVSQMCISNTTTCSIWEPYATSKSWTLSSGDGTKNVYVWFKDGLGNVNSTPYSGSIILDSTAPSNGTLSSTAGNAQVLLSWAGFNDALSGINNYKVVYSTGDTPNSCSTGTQSYYGADTTYTHTALTNGVTYNYRVCAVDNANNISSGATASAAPIAPIPNISASPTSLNFGSVNVNTTSTSQAVTVTNVGTGNLSISVVTLTGTNSSEYIKQIDTCSGNTLPPSQSCNVQIAFMLASAGAKTATFTVYSDDPDTPTLNIPLSGTGIQQSTQSEVEVVLSCQTNVTAGNALSVTVKLYNYDCASSVSVNRLMMQLMGNSSGTLMGLGIWGPYNKSIATKTVSAATCDEFGNVTPGGPVSFSLTIMSQTPASLAGKMAEVTVDAITSKGESLGSGSCMVNVQ